MIAICFFFCTSHSRWRCQFQIKRADTIYWFMQCIVSYTTITRISKKYVQIVNSSNLNLHQIYNRQCQPVATEACTHLLEFRFPELSDHGRFHLYTNTRWRPLSCTQSHKLWDHAWTCEVTTLGTYKYFLSFTTHLHPNSLASNSSSSDFRHIPWSNTVDQAGKSMRPRLDATVVLIRLQHRDFETKV